MSNRAEVRAGFARIEQLEADQNIAGLIGELSSDVRGRSNSSIIRAHAARALGRLRDPRAIPKLVELAHDPESTVRMDVYAALGKLKPHDDLGVVLEGVADSAPVVRMAAATALGRVGDRAAIPRLRTVVENDPNAEVRMHAAEALAVLGDTEVADQVPRVLSAVSWRVRGSQRWKRLKEWAKEGGRLEAWYYPWD